MGAFESSIPRQVGRAHPNCAGAQWRRSEQRLTARAIEYSSVQAGISAADVRTSSARAEVICPAKAIQCESGGEQALLKSSATRRNGQIRQPGCRLVRDSAAHQFGRPATQVAFSNIRHISKSWLHSAPVEAKDRLWRARAG